MTSSHDITPQQPSSAGTQPGGEETPGSFYIPGIPSIEFALARKQGGWLLIFARPYGLAEGRQMARLDLPSAALSNSTHDPSINTKPRFFFDPAASAGLPEGHLLDALCEVEPPILRRTGQTGGTSAEVEVLLPASRMQRWCEGCGAWESTYTSAAERHIATSRPASEYDTEYLCQSCEKNDWVGSRIIRAGSKFFRQISESR